MAKDLMPEILNRIRQRTPARLFLGRSGGGYLTSTQLALRSAHAAARDAVRDEFDLPEHLGQTLLEKFGIFETTSSARSKDEYLLRPDLGRKLSDSSRELVRANCASAADLQIVIGDGLSTTAVKSQVPTLLPEIRELAETRGWRLGRPFAVRFCRVGILNDIGDILHPEIAVLLIGERPGLATAESLSAYLAYRPRPGHTDAERNLISNIHQRGVTVHEAAARIMNLAEKMREKKISGTQIREQLTDGSRYSLK